jgi:hypothetical protein
MNALSLHDPPPQTEQPRRDFAPQEWTLGRQNISDKQCSSPIESILLSARPASVINAATTNVTNARSEGLNSKIQWIKRKACGYRNRQRFHNAIYFHLADLDLYPDSLQSTHTKA